VGNTILPRHETAGGISCSSCIYIQKATNPDLDPPADSVLWLAENISVLGNILGVLENPAATGGRNSAIIDMTASDKNNFLSNQFELDTNTTAYWLDVAGVNKYLGDARIMHNNGNGVGVGTDSPRTAMEVLGTIRATRPDSVDEFIDLVSSSGRNDIISRSNVSDAQKLFINSTTDDSNTPYTGGAVAIHLRTMGVDRFVVDEQHIRALNLPTSSSGLPSGALWNDSGTVKVV